MTFLLRYYTHLTTCWISYSTLTVNEKFQRRSLNIEFMQDIHPTWRKLSEPAFPFARLLRMERSLSSLFRPRLLPVSTLCGSSWDKKNKWLANMASEWRYVVHHERVFLVLSQDNYRSSGYYHKWYLNLRVYLNGLTTHGHCRRTFDLPKELETRSRCTLSTTKLTKPFNGYSNTVLDY